MTLRTEHVQISQGTGTFAGYLVRPDDAVARPAVLVFMEIFGINAHIRSVTERLAGEGYVALAVDFFHRTGPGLDLGYDQAGLEEGRKHLRALKQEQLLADIESSVSYLATRADVRPDAYAAIGFCVGGHVAYLAATTGHFQAAVSLYGGGIAGAQGFGGAPAPLSRVGQLRGHLLCLFGGKDSLIPADQVAAVRSALEAQQADHEIVVYEQAGHGFFCELRSSYDAEAAADAWRRILALFADKLHA